MVSVQSLPRRRLLRQFVGGCVISWTSLAKPSTSGARAAAARPVRPLILLDAGHGGRDLGATGVAGTLEKHVTLGSALALKASLEAGGRYRVALTRATDEFVPLDDRVDIARDLGAALFLSLHADKVSDGSVRGASVYTLANRGSSQEAESLAARENQGASNGAASGRELPADVSRILNTLASREIRAASFRMAHQLVRDMARDVPILPSPERQANFAVLHAAGIPSVLIEMGFLSNAADEAALNNPGHRGIIARSMTRAVDAWFARAHADNGRPEDPSHAGLKAPIAQV